MNIYVGNLDYKVDENDLTQTFEEYGAVSEVNLITDKYSGRSKGFAFVVMDNNDEAQNAIDNLNGTSLKSRAIVVNESRPKKQY